MLLGHVLAGAAALLLGPFALAGRRWARVPYRALVVVVAMSALALTWSSDLPAAVRVLLAAVAATGCGAVAVRAERALRGSYVALVAAVAFVSGPVWAGLVVVAAGSAAVHAVPVRR